MAITTVAATYNGQGPAQTGQILAESGLMDGASQLVAGHATVTGDGASSSFVINLIDGTKTIAYTPSVVIMKRNGGGSTGTVGVVNAVADNKIITVTTSAAVSADTFTVSFLLLP